MPTEEVLPLQYHSPTASTPKQQQSIAATSGSMLWPAVHDDLPTQSILASSGTAKTAGNTTGEYHFRLRFDDFVDLQTRLVLLPRIEAEGRGAKIASYQFPASKTNTETTEETFKDVHLNSAESEANSQNQNKNMESTNTGTGESSQEHRDDDETTTVNDLLVGCAFCGLESQQQDWSQQDFTQILASLREEANKPLVLIFSTPAVPKTTNDDDDDKAESAATTPASITTSTAAPTAETTASTPTTTGATTPSTQESLQTGMMALSAWGMRMRAQASVAATSISHVAKERAKQFQSPTSADAQRQNPMAKKACDIFIQTSVGAFLPVSVAQSKVTTSTLVYVRKSATEPAPRRGWSYQWYRSTCPNKENDDASVSTGISGSTGTSSPSNEAADVDPAVSEVTEWTPIMDATNASLQPDATLVGRKLKCVVSMHSLDDSISSEDSDNSEDLSTGEEVCEMTSVVHADANLFNGARQALLRGARFGNLKGRGNASGRTFRLEVAIGMPSKQSQRTTSALHIIQQSGQEGIFLTEEPILQAIAKASPTNAKHMDLSIAVNEDSVLSALCTDGYFQLETPNRLTRETFLMTLGIANYTGKPAHLQPHTLLFPDRPRKPISTIRNNTFDDEASVSSASVLSNGSPTKSLPPSSPQSKSLIDDNSVVSPSRSIQSSSPVDQPVPSSPPAQSTGNPASTDTERIAALEQELEFLRGKLSRKDKVVSELQRQITQSDNAHEKTQQALSNCRQELQESKKEQGRLNQALHTANKRQEQQEAKIVRLEADHGQQTSMWKERHDAQKARIAELEKSTRAVQNEKAVLQAAVDARDGKLTRMGELQSSLETLSNQVAQQDALRAELETSQKRYEDIQSDLRKVEQVEQECRTELENAKEHIEKLTTEISLEHEKAISCHSQLDVLHKKIQQLKGERNNYKQKNDSLAKEVALVCKNGRTMKDIEAILAEHPTRMDEIETLRKQKRKALEEAHEYRTLYEATKMANDKWVAGVPSETVQSVERTAELERLLAEMTEYVHAKEMQLETMKQVNEHLQHEIHSLAQANFDKNDV